MRPEEEPSGAYYTHMHTTSSRRLPLFPPSLPPILAPCQGQRSLVTAAASEGSTSSNRPGSPYPRPSLSRSASMNWRHWLSATTRDCIKSRQRRRWKSREERSKGCCKAAEDRSSTPSSTARRWRFKNLSMCTFVSPIDRDAVADGAMADAPGRCLQTDDRLFDSHSMHLSTG